jgi:hypothetical protein
MLPRPDRPHDQLLTPMARSKAVRAESVWAALGGVLAGYVLWLIAFSIGDFLTTAGVWGPIVLAVSAVFALGAALWARRVRARGNLTLAAFAFGLPVLPVLLTVLVLADTYL